MAAAAPAPKFTIKLDGESFDLVASHVDAHGLPPVRQCPCGGWYMLGWFPDDEGKAIGGMPVFLHSAEACEWFRSLDLARCWVYMTTGRVPKEPEPVVIGERPAKVKR
jgi:hypothetical protein